ncbi:MAG: ADP-ribosylglycohydrolase family protein [Planctomycetes bacterium]|nr:ADP-ribosylglycohydrolase family protein [Planctomycetota bacterium]MBL7142875.1 ADP-ribosylglycohydrolase family protein [Phycisphaerae bacterium]
MKIKDFITTTTITFSIIASLAINDFTYAADNFDQSIDMPAETLRDKIRGGLLGQLLGNLNGLEHEMKYINAPGNVKEYTPALLEGARTDDDTDLEWVYIVAMQRNNTVLLPPELITQLWLERINNRIWCSNQYARQLMDIGFQPPLTGSIVFNPWANFNISGQFICESFGLVAPAMPQTAAKIGLNYTRVTIDAEPAQTTQLFTTMIATAFITDDIDNIIDSGLKAIDKNCAIRTIVNDVRKWHRLYPHDWRTTRRIVKEKYSLHGGEMRDRNGHELNTASTIAALLYGRGDFVKTLITAFNFGWDADNNAATSGTIIGVIKGCRWMMQQNWQIVDRYHNTTRDNMPMDETITSFADRIIDLAECVIIENGGQRKNISGQIVYQIPTEKPMNIVPLPNLENQIAHLQTEQKSAIINTIKNETDTQKLAFAAYSAICLDLAQSLNENYPKQWSKALVALNKYPKVVQVLFFHSPFTEGDLLRKKALTAGLKKPEQKIKIW